MNLLSSFRYLIALHEHQHFGRAAKACSITQPALSNALRALEDEFGVAIVKRDRNYAGLTFEGHRVLASAQAMLREHALLQQELSHPSVHGQLTIAAVPTALPVAARFASALQKAYPGITPVILSMNSTEIEQRLDDLSLDMAMGYLDRIIPAEAQRQIGVKVLAERLLVIPQYTELYVLLRKAVKGGRSRKTFPATMTWQEASELPLCLLTPDMHYRSLVDAAFRSAGVKVKPIIETNSVFTMMQCVMQGEASSVLSGALLSSLKDQPSLEAVALVSPEICSPIGILSHAKARPSLALQAVLTLATDARWIEQMESLI